MPKNDYLSWSKEDLIKKVKALEKRKKYGLVWDSAREPEKIVLDCQKELPVLKEISKNQIQISKDDITHILIEGDNYHALSVLNYTHEKAIDVIYIDPPFNTGARDWTYNNNYIDSNDAFRHSKWLSFMKDRLVLAKRLLTRSGFLICAIDANEIFSLGLLLDEIFGESNRVGLVTVIHNPKGRNLSKYFSENSEFMLIYAKDISCAVFNDVVIDEDKLATFDLSDDQGKYRLEPFMRVRTSWSRENKPRCHYPIYVSKDLKDITLNKKLGYYEVFPKTEDGREWAWKNIPETFDKLNKNGYFVATFENERAEIFHQYREKQVFKNVWTDKKYQSEFHGTNVLKDILGENAFEYPKSVYLLEDILKITSKEDSIVLDYFAGSGTTGHALLNLNFEDGGKRQFILCTNNENNICTDICYPRIANVIRGYTNRKGESVKGLGGNLKYYTTAFVPASPTDKNKELLTLQSTEILTLKEGTFEKVTENPSYVIYRNSDKYTGIIFDQLSFTEFKKSVAKINKPISLYIFSLADDDFSDDFADMRGLIKICAIPESILRVYRRIFR
jgi:adenine-specific DNA-methyltransferase